MKPFVPFVLSILLNGCVGLSPHSNPTSVTDFEINMYKFGMEKGCTDQGRRKGEVLAKVSEQCACILATFNRNLSQQQWQLATFAAQNKQDRQEANVFAPFMAQTRACK